MSKSIMSRSLTSKGSFSNAKKPGFRTAQTYMQYKFDHVFMLENKGKRLKTETNGIQMYMDGTIVREL